MRKKNREFLKKILAEIRLLQIIKPEFFNAKLKDLEQEIEQFILDNSKDKKLEYYIKRYKRFKKEVKS